MRAYCMCVFFITRLFILMRRVQTVVHVHTHTHVYRQRYMYIHTHEHTHSLTHTHLGSVFDEGRHGSTWFIISIQTRRDSDRRRLKWCGILTIVDMELPPNN